MAYEPGTTDCRVLIDSKAQIEAILLNLAKLENTEHIRQQLVAVHNQLEGLHELRRQTEAQHQLQRSLSRLGRLKFADDLRQRQAAGLA
jgi:hypothetical protein